MSGIGTKHWLLTVLHLSALVILRTIKKECGIRKNIVIILHVLFKFWEGKFSQQSCSTYSRKFVGATAPSGPRPPHSRGF